MVGIEIFRDHFKDFRECYIVIGGVACEDHFEGEGVAFRATKDIDMILVVEALGNDFIAHFWEFIRLGKYEEKQIGEGERQYYRFIKPATEHYPMQIELFSRTPDVITRTEDMVLTPIPADEELSSLSAILMDDEYYEFTIKYSEKGVTIHRADDLALICLKAKAFLDLTKRKDKGENIDTKNIKKHKNDVFRLAATLREDDKIDLPEGIKNDLIEFVKIMSDATPDVKAIMKDMGVTAVTASDLLDQIKQNFKL
jgi:hypothetical protein